MTAPRISQLTIIGVGLIGGSIGQAARQRRLAERVVGVGWRRDSLDRALALGALDDATLDPTAAVRQAEIVVFCTPVDQIVAQVVHLAPLCPPGTLLTDVGSTKGAIVRSLDGRLPTTVDFVGSHPLAGSEKRGPEHAVPHLFEGRLTVITPTEQTRPAAVARTRAFWQALGSRVQLLSPEEHDRALALTSHLPHLVASALASILPPEWAELTASGFRDTTRIASGDPSIWVGIFRQNRDALLDALNRLGLRLDDFREALRADDAVRLDTLLSEAKIVRDALGS
ncbi:MAG: prephenate dehydrogenase/arogenate dehydrogenase family protein [Gemmataceae bacterium]|nr:prephenate dehydrogenase/arogenate dehydrogenase family protein [Gemmataceae bacterium]MDW8265248.1 prephenate dehydrogenase/arogenate dehydrogenase family protein [Gemmataceae bacterium]